MKTYKKYLPYTLLLGIILTGCGGESGSNPTTDKNTSVFMDIEGMAQKGPFQPGSVITIHELDSNLEQTGNNYTTQIQDYSGNYSVSGNLDTNIVELLANGYFFNELSNNSDQELQLSAFAKLNSNINLNIATALIKGKIKQLFISDKISLEEASAKATQELLKLYGYSLLDKDIPNFFHVHLLENTDSSAILLSITTLTMELAKINNITISSQIALISSYLGENNIEKINETKQKLASASKYFIFHNSYANLAEYFENHGIEFNIANFWYFIDADGDGIFPEKTKPVFTNGEVAVATTMPEIGQTVEIDFPISAIDYKKRNIEYRISKMPSIGDVKLLKIDNNWIARYSVTIQEQIDRIDTNFTVDTSAPEPANNPLSFMVAIF